MSKKKKLLIALSIPFALWGAAIALGFLLLVNLEIINFFLGMVTK